MLLTLFRNTKTNNYFSAVKIVHANGIAQLIIVENNGNNELLKSPFLISMEIL